MMPKFNICIGLTIWMCNTKPIYLKQEETIQHHELLYWKLFQFSSALHILPKPFTFYCTFNESERFWGGLFRSKFDFYKNNKKSKQYIIH